MAPTLLVSRRLPPVVEQRAAASYSARLNANDEPYSAERLLALAQGADGLLVCPGNTVDAALIGRLPASVKIVATYSVGFDHIDVKAAAQRGLVVTNTPEVLTDATADTAILLMLAAARRAGEGERLLRAGQWDGWRPTQLLGTHVSGKRLGILGMGRIGQAVAKRARGFDMVIHYSDIRRLGPAQEQGAIYHADPDELLGHVDVLSLHMPGGADTAKFLNAARLARLPKGAVVVNSARGTLVDDDALIAALKSGHIAAAGLDVYANEPHLHAGYRTLENVCLLPHLGSATVETRNAMGFRALDNLDAFFAGKPPPDRVA
ncbi:MAG: D-glycerate dehydrogenase [Proteobacteria bacterium]|nr:D-glycerate dehydrogenase [Pseudomonadota bacterium]